MLWLGKLAELILPSIFGVIDKAVPDKDLAVRLKTEIQSAVLSLQGKELDAAKEIITAEARGESWLQRNWRPVTMLTFVALVVAKWLGYTAAGVTQEIELQLMELIKIGLGGYVVGRSAEKIAERIAPMFKK